MVGSDGAMASVMRALACRPSSTTGANGPAVPFTLTNRPEKAPTSSRTATHRRAGVGALAADQATSVQMSFAPAGVLNGAAGTGVQVAAGAPVRVNNPALVAATNVVAVAGSTARRKIPRPARLVASGCQIWSKSGSSDGPTARSTPMLPTWSPGVPD